MKHVSGPVLEGGLLFAPNFLTIASLDGHTQFPPTVRQPERLAAGNRRGQVEIRHKVQLGIQSAWRLDALPQSRSWWHGT